ncbi:MAG TPA: hypothetical protein VKH20_08660 [Solirubrobacterales bacterium]|nr:hypothetical protein [Solirubrobacterales bacterium]
MSEQQADQQKERDEKKQVPGTGTAPPDKAVPPAFEPGRQPPNRDEEASDDLQNDPAYEPEEPGLKGIKGG